MSESPNPEDRLLDLTEREMVAQTRASGLTELSKDDLQALGKRLRKARDRARRSQGPVSEGESAEPAPA